MHTFAGDQDQALFQPAFYFNLNGRVPERSRRLIITCCLSLLAPWFSHLKSQTVQGSTVGPDGQALPGVVLLLLDSASTVVARALSAAGGQFRIAAPHAGMFRLRALRIGFSPITSESFTLENGERLDRRLDLSSLPMILDTVRVSDRSACGKVGSPGEAAFAVWDQARTALTATELTTESDALQATTITYDRTFDPNLTRLRDQTADVHASFVATPWRTLPPDSLHISGYVATDPDSQTTIYYAPGIDAITSPLFIDDHCFKLQRSTDASLVGVAFQPIAERRRIPEVRGTLWLDRRTLALRTMEFEYTNLAREVEGRARGTVRFASLASGEWVITGWSIQMPVVALPGRSRSIERSASTLIEEPRRIVAMQETGGILAMAWRGTDTLWVHPRVTLIGFVRDSSTGRAVQGAVVATDRGTASITDSLGRFAFRDLVPGSVNLTVRTPALDSLGVVLRKSAIAFDASPAVTVMLPDARRVFAARASTLIGVVLADSSDQSVAGAEVSLADLGLATRADDRGRFRLERIVPGNHRLVVRHVGFAPLDQQVTFGPRTVVNRSLHLFRTVELDSVIVQASSDAIPEFDEDRKIGLGHFVTRLDLDKRRSSHLSEILETIPTVKVKRGPLGQAWVARARGRLSLSATGAQDGAECYAAVFLDGKPVYGKIGGEGSERFDINSLSPEQVESIEYFAGPAETPAKYSGLNSSCGVLVIWTRKSL
jgi:hypothetical protein